MEIRFTEEGRKVRVMTNAELSQKLNQAFGNAKEFHSLIDSHWPQIDRALQGDAVASAAVHEIEPPAIAAE